MVVPIAVEKYLLEGVPIETTVKNHANLMDFCMRVKVRRTDKLFVGDQQIQNTTRYVVTNSGGALMKHMPPTRNQLLKDIHAPIRKSGVAPTTGWLVTECNSLRDFPAYDINYDFYIQQAHKLTDVINKVM